VGLLVVKIMERLRRWRSLTTWKSCLDLPRFGGRVIVCV
jgi:hypothetical protein